MIDNLKKILNEDQDPKAIEKITAKLENLLMSNEEVGYIAVQKKPAVTILPDSIVVTNKRIILCKPKNLGLSMEFVDYDWDDVAGAFVKENILGAEFSFATKTDLNISLDYLPKTQARKLYTYAKEQLDLLKNPVVPKTESATIVEPVQEPPIEVTETEEVTNFAELVPSQTTIYEPIQETIPSENSNIGLTQDQLFEKLQNYKKLLDNGLIMQGEYDNFKKEILSQM
jgi:hypothetical protein